MKRKEIQKIFNDILEGKINFDQGLIKVESGFNLTWNCGYLTAMEAILTRQKKSEFTLKLKGETSLENLGIYFRRFRELSEDILLRDYDKGYFSSWSDYSRFLIQERLIEIIEDAEQRHLTNCVIITNSQQSPTLLENFSKRIQDINKTVKYKIVQNRFQREATSRDVLIIDLKLSSEQNEKKISQIILAIKKTIGKNIFKLIILIVKPDLWEIISKREDMLIGHKMLI
ncbi:MAG: hypothetical protein GTN80_05225 [Nitrososphaeria archaeon]|nr:hypothetical protein [Nitrososphaeria archaeon]NIQ33027.1 hypothetical protein [Nitrososphaeria archaeon]